MLAGKPSVNFTEGGQSLDKVAAIVGIKTPGIIPTGAGRQPSHTDMSQPIITSSHGRRETTQGAQNALQGPFCRAKVFFTSWRP